MKQNPTKNLGLLQKQFSLCSENVDVSKSEFDRNSFANNVSGLTTREHLASSCVRHVITGRRELKYTMLGWPPMATNFIANFVKIL